MSALHARRSINSFEYSIRRCYTTPGYRISEQTPSEAKARAREVKNVAILGGGITGLASAFYLSKQLPEARITLFEGSSRLGGWLHSKRVDVGNGNVVFEQGPRTLRPGIPNGLVTLDLVCMTVVLSLSLAHRLLQIKQLGLENQVLCTSKNSVAAQNRYVYYPDHLVRMPGPGMTLLQNLSTVWKEPVFNGLVSGLLRDIWTKPRSDDLHDESVGSFFTRRLSSKIVDNLISAVLHGIYAGDVYQLGMRMIMPQVWNNELQYGSIMAGFQKSGQFTRLSEFDWATLRDLEEDVEPNSATTNKLREVEKSSVFTFRQGLGELSDRLEAHLSGNPMVKIRRETLVTDLRLEGEGPNQIVSTSES